MNNNHEELEMLDFDNTASLDETIEMLDFESDVKVSNEIDNLLNVIEDNKVEIDVPKEKLDEYVPSIKDFNIKNAKTKKIVKKAMLYVIIVMLLGFEFFITKTGDALNDLRVYASDSAPILISENEKYGYIDYTGNKIVNPKYSHGEDFVKGYAIAKDSSNLPLIIDKGGKEVVTTGTYFTLYRTSDDIIASKVTKKGLKYGILDSSLKVKVDFKYDMISYVDGAYTFTLGNYVGLINLNGMEIFKYKLTDKDNKSIYVSSSELNDDKNDRYGVITINSSYMIVNLNDGTMVTNPTLDVITPEENNVFYKTDKNGNKTYYYVHDNNVVLESIDYTNISVFSIDTGIIKAVNKNYSNEYISIKTKEKISKNLYDKNVYYGQNVFMYSKYDYKLNKEVIIMVKNGEEYKTLKDDYTIDKPFKNGIAIVKFKDNTFGYLNEDGNLISDHRFIEAYEFDSFGEAIAKTIDGYGVINKDGKVIIEFENKEVKMVSSIVKNENIADDNVFYAVKKDNKYSLHNSRGKKINKTYYNEVIFDDKFPVFKVSTDAYDLIVTSKNLSKISLTSFNKSYKAYKNYIKVDDVYYNYNGKLIYQTSSGK